MSFARYTKSDGVASLQFYADGTTHTVNEDHPHFDEIFDLVFSDEDFEAARELIDVRSGVAESFKRVSDRVSIGDDDNVYFDNVAVHGELVDEIIDHFHAGEDFAPLVNFMEKLYVNANADSIDHLFRWLSNREFVITPEGNFVAYKGVSRDDSGVYRSISRGTAIVNGVSHTGNIPNDIGSVVEMPRNEVTFDPKTHCAQGLHAGTWGYASNFGTYVLTVEINPRDVVSVPDDHNSQKLRVCRYRVTGITESPLAQRVISYEVDEAFDDYDDHDYDDDCCHDGGEDTGDMCSYGVYNCTIC